jgi:hypothetical protein
METTKSKFDITDFPMKKVLDKDTLGFYERDLTDLLVKMNKSTFEGGKEIVVDGRYFGMVTFIESSMPFTILTPYRATPLKAPKRQFGFGGYEATTNKLYMFFGGVPTTKDRLTAIKVYNALVTYCKEELSHIKPFAIKL